MTDREQLLERIIFECVGLSDIMRSGIPDGEKIYNEINTKFENRPSIETPDEEGNRIADEMLHQPRVIISYSVNENYDGEWDDEDDEDDEDESPYDRPHCSCEYCSCPNVVRDDGDICIDCHNGVHQG